jgi:phosphoribosyl 1,2-cyclic phosphate phosphodiesterase
MKIKFTGTGDGRGIPAIGCECQLCTKARKEGGKNNRRRVSVILTTASETILFDTPTSIRDVLNEEKILHITAIFLSHKHFDHIGGITEFEYWPEKLSVYGNMSALGNFETTDRLYEKCKFYILHAREPVKVGGVKVTPFEVSNKIPTYGLLFTDGEKRIVHFSDKLGSKLNDYEKGLVRKSDLAIFHTPAFDGETDHIDVLGVISIAKNYPSTRFVISHIGHNNLSHEELEEKLTSYENMLVAFDGLELEV